MCVHKDLVTSSMIGTEDCLFLNIYTPQLPNNIKKEKLPVMLWIHGGGYMQGSGNRSL